ncbi:hypothetical protein VHEMI02488 [[Torrubiella] hemipterigena]|uniref:Uncharacterized protein n=1 Tax=[Torrubiella] hemipterigena TaxID=1531966 RepID=A0A0A1TAN2_9HYPO|nr:hypothetical protein VHEMI02488 [[Torrubiella] hemipterigena]
MPNIDTYVLVESTYIELQSNTMSGSTGAAPPPNQTILRRTVFKKKSKSSSNNASTAERKRTATPKVPERIHSDVLIAIQPVHLQNIVTRKKNHEYRTYRLKDGVERLWLYETRGTRRDPGHAAITHIATILSTIRGASGTVPEEPHGIGNSDFNAGLKSPNMDIRSWNYMNWSSQ